MGNGTIWDTKELTIISCGVCGAPIAMTRAFYNAAKRQEHGWHCPNGHERRFCDNEVEKLREENTRLQHHLNSERQSFDRGARGLEVGRCWKETRTHSAEKNRGAYPRRGLPAL